MKNILVPFDFSNHAKNALGFALKMAVKANARVNLLHVIELPMINGPTLIPQYDYETSFHKDLREKTDKELLKIVETFKSKGVHIVSTTEFGPPATIILARILTEAMDVVVMGSQGMNGLTEFFMGSVTTKVVRKASVPVFIIKNANTKEIKNIVFPNALEMVHQEKLVAEVKALQKLLDARLHIVFINTPANFIADGLTHAKLEKFANHYDLKNYTLNIYCDIDKAKGIREFTKNINGDLIAIGTHGKNGIAHLINGSVSEEVTENSNIPIWSYSMKNELTEA